MRGWFTFLLVTTCFILLFLACYGVALFGGGQFCYRDAGHYYYPLHQRVQAEWNAGRWPLWEPEENAGMPLLGNPTAAVLYPGKLIFAILPYAWAARIYVVAHTALAFLAMLILLRLASKLDRLCARVARLRLRGADLVSALQRHLPCRCGLAAAGRSRGRSLGPPGPAVGPVRAGARAGDAGSGRRSRVGIPSGSSGGRVCRRSCLEPCPAGSPPGA